MGGFNEWSNIICGLNLSVLVGGDFNIIRVPEERIGVSLNRGAMDSFSDFIEGLSLVDLPLYGGRFTWSNFGETASFSRFDRFLLSPYFLRGWHDLIQAIHPKGISDHNPISLSVMETYWGSRPFKWFEYLSDDKAYVE
ncbi:hypothetical protein V6N13_073109 [Hibiscus sabdariffa]